MISRINCRFDRGSDASRQGGVALAIVVWFIAGMSLLVAGIVASARIDTQMAQLHIARAKAVAAGDGAVQLMLIDKMTARDANPDSPVGAPVQYRLGDVDVSVALVPTTGLIDMNSASLDVLIALLAVAGGLDEERAGLIAENVIKSRTQGIKAAGPALVKRKFDSPEDLLRIEGFGRTLLDNVRDFIVVGIPAGGGVDWMLAPDVLLHILDRASPDKAADIRNRRSARADSSADTVKGLTGNYRADAIVRYGDSIWLRRRWIASGSGAASALPWHTVRTEPPRVLMKDSILLGRDSDA